MTTSLFSTELEAHLLATICLQHCRAAEGIRDLVTLNINDVGEIACEESGATVGKGYDRCTWQ